MRVVSILAAIAVLALIAVTLAPELGAYHRQATLAALVAAAVVLVTVLARGRAAPAPKTVKAEAAKPAPPPPAANQAEAEIVSFLATLQEKGRFVDFLMEDITGYKDQQVGAAARVVHDGCKAALNEHFAIRPVRDEREGAAVTVEPGYAADEILLVGKISGDPPFSGKLVHRGWKTGSVKLPRVLRTGGDRLPTIAPAQVELE